MNIAEYLTPTNIASERERFFASSTYNPQFAYRWSKELVKEWADQSKYRDFFNTLHGQDHNLITSEASKLFDTTIDHATLHYARSLLVLRSQSLLPTELSPLVDAFDSAFKVLSLFEYKAEIVDEYGFNCRPSPSQKKILISKHADLSLFGIDGQVKHELVHIIRYENGKANRIARSPAYLPDEEGLATYCQDYHSTGENYSLFQHAAEYAVTAVAMKSSLRDGFDYLVTIGFPHELAWQRIIRHKFGFIDTGKPGDIMKPSMYFYHQQEIRGLSNEEKIKLFVGKITTQELSDYPEYSGRVPLQNLLNYYHF